MKRFCAPQVMVTNSDDMEMDEDEMEEPVDPDGENGYSDKGGLSITLLVAISKPSQKQANQAPFSHKPRK
jgi:hypothetical protein